MEGRVRKKTNVSLRHLAASGKHRCGAHRSTPTGAAPLPDAFLAGVFLFQQLGLPSPPAQWERPGLPATAPGPWRARVSPLRRGFPFMQPLHPATTMPTGAYLAGPPPGAGAAFCPSARRRRRFSCRQKVLKWGRAALQPLKPPLTAARLPSCRDSGTGFVHCARPRLSAQFHPSVMGRRPGSHSLHTHAALGRPLVPAEAADIPSRRDTRLSRLTKTRRTSPSPAGSNRLCGALLFVRRRRCAWC
jgi:hypothetical protein